MFRSGGVDIHYRMAGHGRPGIVLVHGGMCSLADWDRQVADLQDAFTVLALDLPCHGRSGGDPTAFTIPELAGHLNRLVEAAGLAPAVLVGHSLASRAVAEAAFQSPENCAAVVLVDGSRSDGGLAATAPSGDEPEPAQRSLEDILDLTIGPFAPHEVRQKLIARMSVTPFEVMAAAVTAMRDWDIERADEVFGGLGDIPLIAIQSTYHDRHTPRRSLADEGESTPYLDFLRSVRPDVAVTILSHTGHFSMVERSETVSRLIRLAASACGA